MKIEGSYTFEAPRDIVWPMLLDPQVLANVMPGCEKLEVVGENRYEGVLKIKVGPVQGKFNGKIALSDINTPESYQMDVDGTGPAGFVKGVGGLRLEAQNGVTIMHYTGDAQVGGRIASVGQRLLDTSAKAIIRQSLEGLDQQIQARVQAMRMVETAVDTPPTPASGPMPPSPPPLPEAPTQTEFALGVAKNFIEELVPEDQREELLMKGLMILGGLFVLRILTRWWAKRIAHEVAQMLQNERR